MIEEWRKHPDYPYHEVSNFGEIRVTVKLNKFARDPGTILAGTYSAKGYRQVRILDKYNVPMLCWIHRLVLETFIGPAPEGLQTRHLDGNPRNNRLDNLCWGTPKENQADRALHGTDNKGERNPMYKHGWYM